MYIRLIKAVTLVSAALFLSSCAVMSSQVRSEAIPPMPFPTLVQNADNYRGKTVVLGGYILETKSVGAQTEITVLETPLSYVEEPGNMDTSQGRFVVYYNGFLDPAVYRADRKITVGGVVEGTILGKVNDTPYTMLKLQAKEVYLWPIRTYYPYYYYGYPYGYPYPYWFYGDFDLLIVGSGHHHGGFHGRPGGFYGGGHGFHSSHSGFGGGFRGFHGGGFHGGGFSGGGHHGR